MMGGRADSPEDGFLNQATHELSKDSSFESLDSEIEQTSSESEIGRRTESPLSNRENDSRQLHGGYSYWKRDIPDAHLLPSSIPQKIDPLTQPSISPSSSLMSVSAWNSLGTWEERNVTKKTENRLSDLLQRNDIKLQCNNSETVIQLRNIRTRSCESTICFVRGKPRFGYEIALEGFWKIVADTQISGRVSVENLTDHDDLPDVSLSTDSSSDDEFSSEISGNNSDDELKVFWNSVRRSAEKEVARFLKSVIGDIEVELTTKV